MRKCCLCLAPTALVCAMAAGIIAFAVFPSIIEKKVEKEIVIKNNTEAWDRFVEVPITLQWKIYFFHIKNGENFDGDASKLEYEEKGPYIYDEYWFKDVYNIADDGDSLNYTLRRMYTFNPKLSGDNQPTVDSVTIANPGIQLLKETNQLTVTDNVDSIAFGGSEQFLPMFKGFKLSLFTTTGLRGNRYLAEEEVLNITTGKKDPKKVLEILSF